MKITNLSPTYTSDSSYMKKQPIPIDIKLDPTSNSITAPFKQAKWNGYISPIGGNKNLTAYLLGLQNNFNIGPADVTPSNSDGSVNTPETGTPPLQVANLAASYVGGDVVLTFDFDVTDPANQYALYFNVGLSVDGGSTYTIIVPSYDITTLSTTSINQTVTVKSDASGFADSTSFNYVEVATYDTSAQTAGYVTASLSGSYICLLPAPIISEQNAVSSYIITTTNIDAAKAIPNGKFSSEIIQEYVTTTTGASPATIDAEAASNGGWKQVGEPRTTSPAVIFNNDGYHRWIRAYFKDLNGGHSPISNYVEATPQPLIPNNTLPPSGVSNASAAFGGTSGDDIVVSYTLPTISQSDPNALVSLKVKLVPTSQPTQSGFFYHTVVSGETNFTISSNLIFAQFGNYYSSYSGTVVGVSQYGTESTTVATISTFTKTDTLSTVLPVATIANIIDGYTVQFDFANTIASTGQVYQFFIDPTPWIGNNTNYAIPDYFNATFSSWSNSNPNQVVVSSLTAENGSFPIPSGTLPYAGYKITGTNIPANTWITSISGTGPTYTLNLNNNLTQAPSGTFSMQSKVYDGIGPANVFTQYYNTIYIVVVFYSKYGTRSKNLLLSASPVNPATSVIANAVQIGAGGAIYVGTSKDSGSRIVLGPSINKGPDGTSSSYSGIFAFDYGATSSSAASTAIITNPSAGSYTFETTNAKIADWAINGTQIQNTLSDSATNYVGLSATGTYAFWAGSPSSGGSALAKFTVTPQGAVVARNIQIIGSGNNSDTLLSAGSNFTVKGDGTITARNATINGHLNVDQSSTFNSDITLGSNAYLLALPSGSTIDTGPSVQIAGAGLVAYGSTSRAPTTQITADPTKIIGLDKDGNKAVIAVSYATEENTPISFYTNAAMLGSPTGSNPWIVSNNKISSGKIQLDSANQYITVYPTAADGSTVTTSGVRLYGSSSTSTGYAISVGSLTATPKFYVNHTGNMTAQDATIVGTVTAKQGYIGDTSVTNGKYWTINSNNIISNGTSWIKLDAATDSVISYTPKATSPGSIITFSAFSAGGFIASASATAYAGTNDATATSTSLSAGLISSTGYTVLKTAQAFQVFGTSQASGALPMISIDPTGNSTVWTNNGVPQVVGSSFTSINTQVIYLNTDDIIIGNSGTGNTYFNGYSRIRNITPVDGSGQYLRNIWISPSSSTPSGGFVGDLWVTY